MHSKKLKTILSLISVLVGTNAWAVPIAIIDSGTDLEHPMLVNKAWVNPGETADNGTDDDNNGYVDDINGWNFAESNNQIIDRSYLGKFSPDTNKFFEIQLRILNGTASDEDKKWIEDKRKDKNFIKELTTFGNFVHGTHVAGISSRTADAAKIMAAKIIPTEVKVPGDDTEAGILETQGLKNFLQTICSIFPTAGGPMDDMLMSMAIGFLVDRQAKSLGTIGTYVGAKGMKVANCSFGTSMVQARTVTQTIGKALLKRDLSSAEIDKYAHTFMDQMMTKGKSFTTSAPNTLFVMAAGNDGTNNDKDPAFPAGLKFDNTITVAATRGYDRLASFSNYGAKQVEIAAPGVGIVSSIPGNAMMAMSGTSQAAPFITHLAGKILDTNEKLTLTQVKQIMMQTVDKKDFLEGFVTAGGIANEERALHAAELTLHLDVDAAIHQAQLKISDVGRTFNPSFTIESELDLSDDSGDDGMPIPLPSLFN